jgi:amino acid permease
MNYKGLFKNYILPISTISGSIIGVGFFSLPYIASKVGVWLMLFYFITLTALVLFVHQIFGEISLKTPDYKRFPGFVGFYLGRLPQIFSFVSVILGYFGVLLVYLIVGGEFLNSLLSPFFGQNQFFYTFIYFLLATIVVYLGISTISRFEFVALLFLFISFILVFIKGLPLFSLENIFTSNLFIAKGFIMNIFLPYGAIVFSLWGVGLIPEAEEMLRGNKKSFKRVIIISTLIPAVFFILFTLIVLGITGSNTTESALTGLNEFLGNGVVLISLLMGVVITFSAFITHGLNLKRIFAYDLGIKEKQSVIIACFTPMILFMLGFNSFIGIISFVGGVLLGIDGILILLMYKKIGGKSWLIYSLSLVFILGIVYEIVYFIK